MTKAKTYCDTGFYQEQDNSEGALDKIRECTLCGKGFYAPKVLDFSHFEEMPKDLINSICAEENDIGNPSDCDLVTGWHVNPQGQLDSGIGLFRGQKL